MEIYQSQKAYQARVREEYIKKYGQEAYESDNEEGGEKEAHAKKKKHPKTRPAPPRWNPFDPFSLLHVVAHAVAVVGATVVKDVAKCVKNIVGTVKDVGELIKLFKSHDKPSLHNIRLAVEDGAKMAFGMFVSIVKYQTGLDWVMGELK